ncbi:hypothetical protein BsWGS_11450 [Bradybaena similaris]
MASVTSPPWIYSSNNTHGISGSGPSSWQSLTISQILLPVVCAVFISLVVVVIACCLIQRKPKSAGKWRKKSCHTIETSHETSDIGVYDVIDEVNVSTYTPEKTARQCTKLDSNYILGSHLLGHSKIEDVLPAALTPASIPFQAAPYFPPHPRGNEQFTAQISAYVQKSPDCSEEVNQHEGIYETLDRHAVLRNEGNEFTQQRSIDRSLSFYHRDMKNISRNILQSENVYETLNRGSEFEKSCSLCHCSKDTHIKDAVQDLHALPPTFQTAESHKIVCQLSMFKVSSTQERPTLIDKAYYRVQSQTTPCICTSSEDISTMFHNRSLPLAQHRFREKSPECGDGIDLILKPVCDSGGYVNNLRDSNTYIDNLQKILMTHQKSLTVDPQRHPEFSDTRYERLRVTNSDLCSSDDNHIERCNISNPFKCSGVPSKCSGFTTSSEATRISAKLGPLPPLPVKQNVWNEMRKSNSSPQQTNDIKFGCSQTKSGTSSTSPPAGNSVRNQHSVSTSVCPPLGTPQGKRSTVNILNEQVDLLTCRVRSVNNRCRSDIGKTDSHIPCVINTRNVNDNLKVDSCHENSNIYFILEPASDVSSLSSDTEDTTDRHPMKNYNFR